LPGRRVNNFALERSVQDKVSIALHLADLLALFIKNLNQHIFAVATRNDKLPAVLRHNFSSIRLIVPVFGAEDPHFFQSVAFLEHDHARIDPHFQVHLDICAVIDLQVTPFHPQDIDTEIFVGIKRGDITPAAVVRS